MPDLFYKVRTRGSNGDVTTVLVKVFQLPDGHWAAYRDGWGTTPEHKHFNSPELAVGDLAKRANQPFLGAEPLQSGK